jgi:hypothetical protein
MRTTLSIDDQLLREAKQVALYRGCTLGEVVEQSLRLSLSTQLKRPGKDPFLPIKTYGEGGVQAGVDLSNSVDLLDRMENG